MKVHLQFVKDIDVRDGGRLNEAEQFEEGDTANLVPVIVRRCG